MIIPNIKRVVQSLNQSSTNRGILQPLLALVSGRISSCRAHTHTLICIYIYTLIIPKETFQKAHQNGIVSHVMSCIYIYIYIYCIYTKYRRVSPINPKRHTFCQNQVTSISALLKEIQVPEPMPRCIAMPPWRTASRVPLKSSARNMLSRRYLKNRDQLNQSTSCHKSWLNRG